MEIIQELLLEQFGEKAISIQRYAGEINLNFKCTFPDNKSYNLKLFHSSSDLQSIDFLAKIHEHCNSIDYIKLPKIKSWKSEEFIHEIVFEGEQYKTILLEWIDGKLLSDINYHPPQLLYNWGVLAAQLQKSLSKFSHPQLDRIFEWDCIQLDLHKAKIKYLRTDQERDCIEEIFIQFRKQYNEVLSLPKAVNHNDLHTENLVITFDRYEAKLNGLIDFGDALRTTRISEIAIACAYAMMDKKDPLKASGKIIEGYSSIVYLEEKELACLDILIRARLAISVLTSAKKRANGITDPYQFISEKKAWDVLNKLSAYPMDFIHYYFRASAGFTAHPHEKKFIEWCKNNTTSFKDVIDINPKTSGNIDLSVSSFFIPSTSELQNIKAFDERIESFKKEREYTAVYGGYGEIRPVYTTDNYETENDEGYQWRTQHLGLDIWTALKGVDGNRTKVLCPYDGEVLCAYNNDIPCDYGGTIIIRHIVDNLEFYTLYGHLSLDSLDVSPKGKKVKAGDHIAYLGDHDENGHWPVHLHFQVMLDLLENTTNYPGVAYAYEWHIWKSICPNPSLLYPSIQTTEYKPFKQYELIESRKRLLGKNLSVSYNENLTMVRGHMQYLYDISGRRYLDTVNNVAHVGHEHPLVCKLAAKQIQLLNTNTRYLHPEILKYAENLLDTFPSHLTRVYFTNSGSESNELALRIAEAKTRSNEKLVLKMGYHGNTRETVNVSSYKFERQGGKGIQDGISMVDYFSDDMSTENDYLRNLKSLIKEKGALSFIHESILSCAGQVELNSNVLREMYKQIQGKGGICIADEVQTGFGRVGHEFWAFQLHEIKPDIVTMGKPIGNGHPVAAVVCTEELAELFDNGMEYFNTFAGNPVSMKIANTVLGIVKKNNLQEHALEMENLFYELSADLSWPADIQSKMRGKGLFLGLELMEKEKEATRFVSFIKNRMRQRGFLMSSDGLYENVLKIKPPMVFGVSDMRKLIDNIQLVINEYAKLND